jgi:hypothetical protein
VGAGAQDRVRGRRHDPGPATTGGLALQRATAAGHGDQRTDGPIARAALELEQAPDARTGRGA